MVRFTALVPVVCSIGALVLSFLVLFAGSSQKFLNNGQLVTVSASSCPLQWIPTDVC